MQACFWGTDDHEAEDIDESRDDLQPGVTRLGHDDDAVEIDAEHRCRLDSEFTGADDRTPSAVDRRTGHEQGRQAGRRDAVSGTGLQLQEAVQRRVRTHRLSRRPALHPTDLDP